MTLHRHHHALPNSKRIGLALVVVITLIATLSSCKPKDLQTGIKPLYFDLAGFIKADIARQKKLNQLTLKTIIYSKNKAKPDTETKKVHIDDWALELNSFIESDINKPAWRGSYSEIKGEDGTVIDTALTPDLKTRKIVITRNKDNTIKWMTITNESKNSLYQTSEVLAYYPHQYYSIYKKQHVRLLGTNNYYIKGSLN